MANVGAAGEMACVQSELTQTKKRERWRRWRRDATRSSCARHALCGLISAHARWHGARAARKSSAADDIYWTLYGREILYRLVQGPQGSIVRQIARADSRFS